MSTSSTRRTSVSRMDAAHRPLSLFPRTAVTGAMAARVFKISASPMSPAWTMKSLPCRNAAASGRRSPWVSEMTPTRARRLLLPEEPLAPLENLGDAEVVDGRPLVRRDLHPVAEAALVVDALALELRVQHVEDEVLLGDLNDRPRRLARLAVAVLHDGGQQADLDVVVLLPVGLVLQDLVGLVEDLVRLHVGVVDAQDLLRRLDDLGKLRPLHQVGQRLLQPVELRP